MKNFTTAMLILFAVPLMASAELVIFDFVEGERAGSASFFSSGNGQLTITLTNTSQYDVVQPDQLLNAVFFDLAGNPTLTAVSATLSPGSQVLFNGSQPAGGDVGGEWAYSQSLSGAPGGAGYGISTTGLDLFGPHDLFPGKNLAGPKNVGGMDFGLLSAGDDPTVGNSAVTGQFALISNSVTFALDGLSDDYLLADSISNVRFQYGTSLSDPSFTGGGGEIPEPGTAALLTMGAAFVVRARQRRRMMNQKS